MCINRIDELGSESQNQQSLHMDSLLDIVTKTIRNLESKRSFLEEQRHHYSEIRRNLIEYKAETFDSEDDSEQKGLVFGEVIISSKIYLNIGYEYFVEKSQHDAVEFTTDKLQLIDEAIGRFEAKIKEANETLKNLKKAQELEDSSDITENLENQPSQPENEEGLPFMEIREDLDEDGNIVSSSINPTAGARPSEPRIQEVEERSEPSKHNSSETHPSEPRSSVDAQNGKQGSEIKSKKEDSEKILDGNGTSRPMIEESDENRGNGNSAPEYDTRPALDPNDIYTFDEIVEQLERQDGLEDGEISDSDIHYDFDSYHPDDSYDDTDDDSDDFDYETVPSIVPDFARDSFLQQINKIRSEKQRLSQQVEEPTEVKSILKSDTKPKKQTKKVGFAPKLDVYEVEEMKRETKANTFTGTREPFEQVAFESNVSGTDSDGFDQDLFAKLIGAKDSDEIHEKYAKPEEEQAPTSRKPRISRFKKDRAPASNASPSLDNKSAEAVDAERPLNDIVERDFTSSVGLDKFEPISAISTKLSEIDMGSKNDSTKAEAEVAIVEERNAPRVNEVNLAASKTETPPKHTQKSSLFKKTLKSLQKPNIKRTNRTQPVEHSQYDLDSIIPQGDLEQVTPQDELSPPDAITPQDDSSSAPVGKPQETINQSHASTLPTASPTQPAAFPAEIKALLQDKPTDIVQNPSVDFQKLGNDLDDMAHAYLLGLYNSDVEDPGTVVEKISDLKNYNQQVETLQTDIATFLEQNPAVPAPDGTNSPGGPVVTDVVENEVETPADYDQNDIELNTNTLNQDVTLEYYTLRQKLIAAQGNLQLTSEELELEPIDEHGNPVRISKFRSQKLRIPTDQIN